MRIQYAHNESYSNDLNIDLYPVRIDRFPTHRGTPMTPAMLIKHIRLNINSLLDTSLSKFTPYTRRRRGCNGSPTIRSAR